MYLSNALRFSIFDALFYALMVGFGEAYFSPFALALNHSIFFAGMLITAPLIFGGFLQLISPAIYDRFRSHKKIVVAGVVIQALSFLPLVVGALIGKLSGALLFMMITLYWALSLGISPSWNVWQKSIIPERVRTKFFSNRTLLMAVASFAGIFLGGVILDHYKFIGKPLFGFATLFLFAAFLRLGSAHYLYRQPDEIKPAPLEKITITKLFSVFKTDTMGRMLLFVLGVRFCVFLSAPYFGPYMLRVMKLDYFWFTMIIAASVAGRIMVMGFLKNHLTKENQARYLFIGSAGVALIPFFWTLSTKIQFIMLAEFFSGICWGMFDLTFFLLTFNGIPEERQPVLLSTFNFLHTIVMGVGTLIGGFILGSISDPYHGHMSIFMISSIARALALLLFPGMLLRFSRVKSLFSF